jgi:hypothetical protein
VFFFNEMEEAIVKTVFHAVMIIALLNGHATQGLCQQIKDLMPQHDRSNSLPEPPRDAAGSGAGSGTRIEPFASGPQGIGPGVAIGNAERGVAIEGSEGGGGVTYSETHDIGK